jgi:hypothetical protein
MIGLHIVEFLSTPHKLDYLYSTQEYHVPLHHSQYVKIGTTIFRAETRWYGRILVQCAAGRKR